MKKIGACLDIKCNSFKNNNFRYPNFNEYKKAITEDKTPKLRCKVGEKSEKTGRIRYKNNYGTRQGSKGTFLAEEKEEVEEEEEKPNVSMKIEEKKKEPDFTDKDHDLMDEYGSVLPLEEYCGDCNKPINDLGASNYLLNYNKIVVCKCDE